MGRGTSHSHSGTLVVWLAALPRALPGFAATFVGIGMGRFSLTPLAPQLVAEGWLSATATASAASFMLAGYALGALAAAFLARRCGLDRTLWASLTLTTLALIAVALSPDATGQAVARSITGITGGILMVLGPSAILRATAAADRPATSAIIYAGIGLGIAFSGILIPMVSEARTASWLIAAASFAGSLPGYRRMPPQPTLPLSPVSDTVPAPSPPRFGWLPPRPVLLLALAYGLDAIGYIPHTVYWSSYIARELNLGVASGGSQWVLFGLGALLGAPMAGLAAARLSFQRAVPAALALKGCVVALPLFGTHPALLATSSVLVGLLVPGVVALMSGRLAGMTEPHRLTGQWALLTGIFALFQAAGGALHAHVFTLTGSYRPMFAVASVALLLAAAVAALPAGRSAATPQPEQK